jgi:alcohol dehydrogenase, propanol-preferring
VKSPPKPTPTPFFQRLTPGKVQYALTRTPNVLALDAGSAKGSYLISLGCTYLDLTAHPDPTTTLPSEIHNITAGGAHACIIATSHPAAFAYAADLLRVGAALCLVGIPPGDVLLGVPAATIVIKGLRVQGNLVGSLKETLEAAEEVRTGRVKVRVEVRPFRELEEVYAALEQGRIAGRVVLKVADE